MKTYRNLFDRLASFENLVAAYRAARRGKRGGFEVARFELDWETQLLSIRRDLLGNTYKFGSYRQFIIHEPKERLISAAPFRDRVVHHALVNVLEPIYESRFIHDTYACRRGRGTHRAVLRCQEYTRRYRYVLKADVWKFYLTLDHGVILEILERIVHDERVISVVRDVLTSYDSGIEYYRVFPGDDLFTALRPRGIPIGNLTSQLFANICLAEVDSFAKRILGVKRYVRYMDDMLFFADEPETLRVWRGELDRELASMRLALHPTKRHIMHTAKGVPFLGFRVFPEKRLLLSANVRLFIRRTRSQMRAVECGELDHLTFSRSVQGWIAHASFADSLGLRHSILPRLVPRMQGGPAESHVPGVAGWQLEQRHNEPSLCRSQQQQPDESQQQHRVPVREDIYCQNPVCCGGSGRAHYVHGLFQAP